MKKKMKKVIGIGLVTLLMLSACSNKQNTLGGGGALLGATMGILLGKTKEDRVKYATGLGILFGITGSWIGKNLDNQDQKDLARKAQELANQNQSKTTWQSSHSGAEAELTVVNEYTKEVKETVYEDSNSIVATQEVFEEQEPMVTNNISLGEPIGSSPVGSVNSSRSYERSAKVARGTTSRKNRVTHSSKNRVNVKRTTRESKPKSKRVSRERTVMVKRKCKNVNIAIKLPNGKRGNKTVTTCQDKNGLYGV